MTELEREAVAETVPAVGPKMADLIVAYLNQLGVEYVFGVPGGAIEPLCDALARSMRKGGVRPLAPAPLT